MAHVLIEQWRNEAPSFKGCPAKATERLLEPEQIEVIDHEAAHWHAHPAHRHETWCERTHGVRHGPFESVWQYTHEEASTETACVTAAGSRPRRMSVPAAATSNDLEEGIMVGWTEQLGSRLARGR